ncbi:FkbM family methyltransferase [Flavobacterium sp. JLP]|uniref:FkbM family methyltransferase n=1 Tax=Flavobacterium sp. JLP TaxID=2783793 RepID=UPI00188AD44D|nr:FkbM family methyltransferase [Flavobacterium sp. JLP]MBF4507145.1 FkbM family methyltransferase [Flavobacterium sp. JLP]
MKKEKLKFDEVEVRGISFKLMTYTRSLELCARMNYETENLDFIDLIKPGEVIYDLGACEGRFSIYAALKGIKVVSFEPESKNFLAFSQNIKINNIEENSLKPINAGVGAKNGKAIIKIGQPWEGGHQKVVEHGEIRNDLNFNFVENQEISIVSIDSFVEDNLYTSPNYLKIDIDGSEMPFLIGATKTLKNKNLKGIIFELNDIDPNFINIIEILNKNGFVESKRYNVPNEANLYNIIFYRK